MKKTDKKKYSLNLDLRKSILGMALVLEEDIKILLLVVLETNNIKRKAISKKGSSLSFRDRINLLFDLEIIDNDDYGDISLLMDFRNKFMHDIGCNSFETAVSLFKESSQGKHGEKLLKYLGDNLDANDSMELEQKYYQSFSNLSRILKEKVSEKIQDYIHKRDEMSEFVNRLVRFNVELTNGLSEITDICDLEGINLLELKNTIKSKALELLSKDDMEFLTGLLGRGILIDFIRKIPSDILD
jgi:DNA-binding MltR family transcriptional regulator